MSPIAANASRWVLVPRPQKGNMIWFVKHPFAFLVNHGRMEKKFGHSHVVGTSSQKEPAMKNAELVGPFSSKEYAALSQQSPSLYPDEKAAAGANIFENFLG
jgi:hypothetical protein